MDMSEEKYLRHRKQRLNQTVYDARQDAAQGVFEDYDFFVREHNDTLEALRQRYHGVFDELPPINTVPQAERGNDSLNFKEQQKAREAVRALTALLKNVEELHHDVMGGRLPACLQGHKQRIQEFLNQTAFERNVFVMMRYSKMNAGHRAVIQQAVGERGLRAILADEENLTDDLYNPVACLWCSQFGIALLDQPESDEVVNPNVMYELGMMHALGRECLILKSSRLGHLPSDICQWLYHEYDEDDIKTIRHRVLDWTKRLVAAGI